jgi:hypothetical protein
VQDVTLLPAHQLPPLPMPVPRVYGRPAPQPAVSPAVGVDPAADAGPGAVPYAPAAAQPAAPPVSAPPQPTAPSQPSTPAQVSPPTQPVPFAQPAPFAQPPAPVQPTSPAQTQWPPATFSSAAAYPPPAEAQWPPMPGQPGPGVPQPAPAGPQPAPAADGFGPPADQGNSHIGMLIAVGGVVLLAVVGLIAFMWPEPESNQQFTVGSCVKKSDQIAIPAECTSAGAFKIVTKGQRKEECADQLQPYIELNSGKDPILCLVPAIGGAEPAGSAKAQPSPSG